MRPIERLFHTWMKLDFVQTPNAPVLVEVQLALMWTSQLSANEGLVISPVNHDQ